MIKIPLEWLEECDSTSRVLKEQTIKASFSKPQALAARIQTAGTGRLGQIWQSFAGNLHFSIALPPQYVPEDLRDIMPFVAALIVARWMQKEVGVRPCLKWPNDILLDGRKVAGILCEGSIQGSQFMGVVIGVGINLAVAPVLPDKKSYASGSLKDLSGQTLEPRKAAESLAAKFSEFINDLPSVSRKTILSDWSQLAISDGHLWIKILESSEASPLKNAGNYYRGLGVTFAGHLRLTPCNDFGKDSVHSAGAVADSSEITVSSATHNFLWSGQNSQQQNVRWLVADVGNSQTKMAIIESAKDGKITVQSSVFHLDAERPLADFLKDKIALGVPPIVHALSVNPTGLHVFRSACALSGVDVREINKNPVRAGRSLYDLSAIGADRLALLEAVHYLQIESGVISPFVAVSLGTATTIDHVDASGKHLGGYIAAGLQTSLDAVSNRGACLPKSVSLTSSEKHGGWPITTVEAMAFASLDQTLAFLTSERQRLADYCQVAVETVPLVLTGGFSNFVKKAMTIHLNQKISEKLTADENLILLGAGILALNGR